MEKFSDRASNYYITESRSGHEIFENIDWQSRATEIKGMNDNDKKQIFKMSHGALPVMRQQEILEYSDTTTCPVC